MNPLQQAKMAMQAIQNEIRSLEELKRQKEKELNAAIANLKRVERIAQVAANPQEHPAFLTWHFDKIERLSGDLEVFRFETALKQFNIYISERKDLKKFRFQVEVKLTETYFNGGYSQTDYHYGNRLYREWKPGKDGRYQFFDVPGQEMVKKFSSYDDAKQWVLQWMERITNDHEKEIEEERKIMAELQLAKAEEMEESA